MNYHGNAHARRLARGSSDFLGLIISDIENPFFPGLIKAFESAALKHGYDVLLSTTNYDPQRTEKSFRKMVENLTPGVVVMTSRASAATADLLDRNGVASVFLDSGSVGSNRSNIRLDYAKGAHEAINYLHNLGHRQFAFIAGPQSRPSHAAYRQAVEAALGLMELKPQLLEGGSDVEGGDRAVQRLLTSRNFPTAILCSNDMTAIRSLTGTHARRIAGTRGCFHRRGGRHSVSGFNASRAAHRENPPRKIGRSSRLTFCSRCCRPGSPGRNRFWIPNLSFATPPEVPRSSIGWIAGKLQFHAEPIRPHGAVCQPQQKPDKSPYHRVRAKTEPDIQADGEAQQRRQQVQANAPEPAEVPAHVIARNRAQIDAHERDHAPKLRSSAPA